MKIQNSTLLAECTAYDFKSMLERRKIKSWLKSVSAFANTEGGSLFYGVNDDGIELVSPGAMLDGRDIQDCDVYEIPSMRRNPIIADVFTQLDYMEKRGSGLRKMRELTERLPNFLPGKEPQYKTVPMTFYTTFKNLNWGENGRISVEDVATRINSSEKKFGATEDKYPEKFGVTKISSEKKFGVNKPKSIGRTAQRIIDLVISDPSLSAETMAENIGISRRAVEKQLAKLRELGLLFHGGSDKSGYWRVIAKNEDN